MVPILVRLSLSCNVIPTSLFVRLLIENLPLYVSTNNPVVKVEGRRPETLTTGLFVLSIPGMAT